MIYRFDGGALDVARRELSVGGAAVHIEPQVFALLRLLIENRDRLVSKDEIIDRIWGGRIVSDAAIASRIKSARAAIGDDGKTQRLIRTKARAGVRFVGHAISEAAVWTPEAAQPETVAEGPTRPSIAVLPFAAPAGDLAAAGLGDGLAHDVIVELSRLRWLFVIARASSFRLRGGEADLARVRSTLGVRYALTGRIEASGGRMTIAVELVDLSTMGVVWSERYRTTPGGVHETREAIAAAVVSALELQIPLNEAKRSRLTAPARLDAWSAYHLGLQQLYRFTAEGNAAAQGLFGRAVELDPGFARAHAGLSFTHFENAFLSFAGDRAAAAGQARACAEAGLAADPLDPMCNLMRGRAMWLAGDVEASLPWLDRAVALNPNYAQGLYSRSLAGALRGEGAASRRGADLALRLSPLDPLAYGMLGAQALSHLFAGEGKMAAFWAEQAARAPGAHALIEMIAALSHGLAGDAGKARAWLASARARDAAIGIERFLAAFPVRDAAARRVVEEVWAGLS